MKPGTMSLNGQPKPMSKGRKFSQTTPAPKAKLPKSPAGKANAQGNTP